MDQPATGIEFLRKLKQQNNRETPGFTQFSKYLEIRAREKGIPLLGQFELTPLCNFSCGMCYVHLTHEQLRQRHVLSPETWKDLMRQAVDAGMLTATLTGGECLAYPAFDDLYLFLQDLGCEVDLLTNGSLLDSARLRFFLEHRPRNIQVTLYGWNDDVYERVTGQRAFGIVAENIRRAVDAGLHVTICVTPNPFLGDDVLETVRTGLRLGSDLLVNNSLFPPREETGRADLELPDDTELYARIYRLLNDLVGTETREIDEALLPPAGGPCRECTPRGLRCGGARSSFVIDWQGTMMPCNSLSMIRSFPLKEGFLPAWESIRREAAAWPGVSECLECPYDSVCTNCAGNMLAFAEPGKKPEGLCRQTKFFVSRGVVRIPECN